MKVKYLGHASFLIESEGKRILTDPYESGSFGGEIRYKPIREECDVVLISHEHADHNYTKGLIGSPTIIRKAGEHTVKGIKFTGILSYHDETKGSQRGTNIIYTFTAENITVAFMGDIGETKTVKEKKAEIGKINVLIVPVGGVFTVDAKGANEIVNTLNPDIVIPMHYKTKSVGFPLSSVDEFTKDKKIVKVLETSDAEIKLPTEQEVWVFKPALV